MTKNVDGDSLYSRMLRLIKDYEQARDSDSTVIGRQFAELQREMIANKEDFPSTEGAKPINRLKNRYKDVLPYDKCRVVLNMENNSDYINASFIEDFHGKRRYIAAQGPIEESVEDFFRMIWELQITSIICTANDTEAGRFKFRRYWPDEENTIQFGSYRISIDDTDDRASSYEDFQIRPLIITQGNNRRHVLLYHFIHWLDHDVPNSEAPILKLLSELDADRSASPDTPILVHCSAGCGRTGSIIAIDLCRLLLRDERLLSSKEYQQYPIQQIAKHIRQYRIALIQTVKQYLFVHKMFVHMVKIHGIESLLQASHNEENVTSHSLSNNKPSPPSISLLSSRRQSGPFDLKLGNPPAGRRSNMNGTNTSNNVSPTVLPSEYFPPSSTKSSTSAMSEASSPSEPPPIPPRASLLNATNRRQEGQFVGLNETPVKLRRNLVRSRPVKRREPVLATAATTNNSNTSMTKSNRSDSADALSAHPSEAYYADRSHRAAIIIDSGANSD